MILTLKLGADCLTIWRIANFGYFKVNCLSTMPTFTFIVWKNVKML
jgi:hypothetical protein